MNDDLNAALVAMVEKCAEHQKEIGEFTVGCSCGWFTDSRDSASDESLWRKHVKSIVLPADIMASVERERRKLQLEARIDEAKTSARSICEGCAENVDSSLYLDSKHHHEHTLYLEPCRALPIRRSIAALEAELTKEKP